MTTINRATNVSVGDTIEATLVEDLTRTQIVQYAGAAGDFNPLHSDERFATEVAGYPGVFAHGMLTMAMAGRLLTDWAGPDSLVRYGVRFQAQVWPGDRLVARAQVTALEAAGDVTHAHLDITTRNQDDTVVIAGTAVVRLP